MKSQGISKANGSKKTPSDSKIKAIQDTVRINATERLSIVAFYGAIFIGIISKFVDILNPLANPNLKVADIAIPCLIIGLFLAVLGICACHILIKYNSLIKWRQDFLNKLGEDLDPFEKNENIQRYTNKFFSVTWLLVTIMVFLVSIAVYIFFIGFLYLLPLSLSDQYLIILPIIPFFTVFFYYFRRATY